MTDASDLQELLRRTCLAFNARVAHAGAEAGIHAASWIRTLGDDVIQAMDASGESVISEHLAEAYRCLSFAGDNPLRQTCEEREALLNVACHQVAHAVIRQGEGTAGTEEEVHALLTSQWTASLLAWSEIFPMSLDGASPPCACGALGARQVLVPASATTSDVS